MIPPLRLSKLIRFIRDPDFRFALLTNRYTLFRSTPDEKYLSKRFKGIMGRELNLSSPQAFSDKLQWLKLYERKPEYTQMADKITAKKHVARLIGEKYVIPTLFEWESAADIDFESLPDQFVLKCNHDSGCVCICRDKHLLNCKETRHVLQKAMNKNFFWRNREWVYKDIRPRVFAEQYITDSAEDTLTDYKIYCFNGEPKFISTHHQRQTNHVKNLYTPTWDFIDASFNQPSDPNLIIPKPQCLEEMLSLAKTLSASIPFLRVDFYIVDNRIYFGELTFYPAGGFNRFTPKDLDYTIGSWLQLPEKPHTQVPYRM